MALEDLIARDGGTCVWCGRQVWRTDLTAEHLLPRRRGGRTCPENLTVACRRCNRRRGTQPVVAFVRAQRVAGLQPQLDLLRAALGRLAGSPSRVHADYGARQLSLLQRATAQPSMPPGSAGTSTA